MPRKNMKKGGEDIPEPFSPMAGVVAETPAPVMGGKKKRVYKKKGGEVEDALSSLALLGLQKGMVGAGYMPEMEGGKKKKRVYKKKGGVKVVVGWKQEKLKDAIKDNDINRVQQFIDVGADINYSHKSDYGITPLWLACVHGHLEVARLLIEKGADKDKAEMDGMTPLFAACDEGHLEIVRLLIEKGADLDKANNEGVTPLLIATVNGHLEIVRLLVEAGADKNKAEEEEGMTPLDIAKKEGHTDIIEYLEKGGGTGGGKKKKRVYKKKKGGEDMPEMPEMGGGKKKRVYKKKGGAMSQVAGQLQKLSDSIAKIMKF